MNTNTARIDALETSLARIEALLVSHFDAEAPAAPATEREAAHEAEIEAHMADRAAAKAPKAKKPTPEFIVKRGQHRSANREMAAWLREKNLPTNGPVWDAAKAGQRNVRTLRNLAKKA